MILISVRRIPEQCPPLNRCIDHQVFESTGLGNHQLVQGVEEVRGEVVATSEFTRPFLHEADSAGLHHRNLTGALPLADAQAEFQPLPHRLEK